jgi:hypothetical protein
VVGDSEWSATAEGQRPPMGSEQAVEGRREPSHRYAQSSTRTVCVDTSRPPGAPTYVPEVGGMSA